MTFTCQTNKVVNGAHLELSTETLVKFPHLGLISLDLEKTPQIWLDSDNWKMLKKAGITNNCFKINSFLYIFYFKLILGVVYLILFKEVKDPRNDFSIVLC